MHTVWIRGKGGAGIWQISDQDGPIDMDVGVDGITPAHRDVEFEAVTLDNRSIPFVLLTGVAAQVRVHNWSRVAGQNPPKRCMATDTVVACLG